MVGILVVSHGNLAEGLLDAMKMIVGEQEQLDFLSLKPTDSIEGLTKKIITTATAINRGDGVLIFTDLFGASPFNASGMASQECNFPVDVITGFNLGMLIETIMSREGLSLEELSTMAADAGKSSIQKLSEMMANKQ